MKSILKVLGFCAVLKYSLSFPTEQKATPIVGSRNLRRLNTDVFISPDKRSGKSLKEWSDSKRKGNPEEQGNYFEGDIMIDGEARNGVILTSQKWPKGRIPYEIIGSFTPAQLNMISDAIDEIQVKTCLKFVPRSNEEDYIAIDNGVTGCWSPVGKVGGKQVVNLQTPGCMVRTGTVIHEILHSAGFFHEQNRYDRDKYVKVNLHFVQSGREVNFEKFSEDEISSYGVSYDIDSVLHYSPYAFSMGNQMTIESLLGPSYNDRMGQRVGLSDGDVAKDGVRYTIESKGTPKINC